VRQKELMVGIFAAAAIVLLYFGFNFLKGIDFFATTKKYYAIYENVDNLQISNPVRVSGFAAGRVSNITIIENEQHSVLVEIDIDSKIKLGDSTKAILDGELLGSKYILLAIGKVNTPLKPGDTLRSEAAKGMFQALTETAQPVAGNLQSTLRKFDIAIEGLTKNSRRLDSIFAKLQKTPDILNMTLRNANGKIDVLSASFTDVSANLNTTLTDLRPVIKNFGSLSDTLKRLQLNKTIAKTQQTLTSLNETLTRMKKGDNTVSKLMTEDTLYVNLNRLILRLDTLARNFNNSPKHFLGPLGKSSSKIARDRKREQEKANAAAAQKK
jgi:phospholipid/cholesterol/gamma-HCH transport system substrate-binding protein